MRYLRKLSTFIGASTRVINTAPSPPLTHKETVGLLHKQVMDARKIALPEGRTDLAPRRMDDSYERVTVRLSGSGEERVRYLTAKGTVRIGRLLEVRLRPAKLRTAFRDLDHFAVWLCYLHNRQDVSQIDSAPSLPRMQSGDRDIILDGHVSWVGRSSMETTLRVFQEDDASNLRQVLKAHFVLVSRNAHDLSSAMPVHPLVTTTPEEAAIVHAGAAANNERKYKEEKSLLRSTPTSEEWAALHAIFLDNVNQTNSGNFKVTLQPGQVWMKQTEMKNTEMCFPEFKNIYGKVFGGFLMREAVELGFICAKFFCKGNVSLVSTDDILFREAVNIGDLIQFTARIVYTEGKYMQVRVYAETRGENFTERKMTNEFSFTFSADDAKTVKTVVPDDYGSGMLYLGGKRKFASVKRFCF